MSSKLAVLEGAGPAAFTPDDLALIRATVARDATDAEFKLLLVMARELGLNPLLKEIWCIKRRKEDPALIMTSRDGYMKVARRDPAFEGLSSCAVRKGDDFRFDAATGGVHHSFGAERGPIIGAWAGAYARGRRPCVVFADFSEYSAGATPVWRQYPSAMICKVAESMALKRQFGIDGVVTREEMDASGDYAPPQVEVIQPHRQQKTAPAPYTQTPITVQAEAAPAPPPAPPIKNQSVNLHGLTDADKEMLLQIAIEHGLNAANLKQLIKERFGFEQFMLLTPEQFDELLEAIPRLKKPRAKRPAAKVEEGLVPTLQEAPPPPPAKPSTQTIKYLFTEAGKAQVGESHLRRIMRARFDVDSTRALDEQQVGTILRYLEGLAGDAPRDIALEEEIEAALAALDAQEMAEATEAVVQ